MTSDSTRRSSKPDGTVLSQAPPPGSSVLPGDQIFLVVAKPAPTVLVPDLRGKAEADAINLMIDQGLRPGARSDAFDADVAEGSVVGTNPAAGESVERDSSVDYVVSRGPNVTPSQEPTAEPTSPTVVVPDLTGVAEADAVNQLIDADLRPGTRSEVFDDGIPAGGLVSTDPAAGVEIVRGTLVDYVVSVRTRPRRRSRPPNRPRPPSLCRI